MTKVAGQGNAASLYLGNWFSYELDIDVPSTAQDEMIKVEITTNPPNEETAEPGKTAFVIGNSTINDIGNHLQGIWWENSNDFMDVGGSQVV